jgi:hypothetical protein
MGDWPPAPGGRAEAIGANATATGGTTVSGSGTANVKGSWVELIAATSLDAAMLALSVLVPQGSAAGTRALADIGVGAAGSETTVIENLVLAGDDSQNAIAAWPIAIPAGSRIAARSQLDATTGSVTIAGHVIGGGFGLPAPYHAVTTYGVDAATSRGTAVDPGATANTKGSWVQITASTARAHAGLAVAATTQGNAARSDSRWLVDIGVGAGGSEQVLIPNLVFFGSTAEVLIPGLTQFFPVAVPAGSRLAIRAQSDITDAADRINDYAIYGVS